MNVLWIISSNLQSANSKIAINLANRMKEKHHVSCAIYSADLRCDYTETKDIFAKTFPLGGFDSKGTPNLSKDSNWLIKSKPEKIVYLLQNPAILSALLRRKMAESEKKCIQQLEEICNKEKIDAVIGVVFPRELMDIIAGANIRSKKIILQLDPYVNNVILSSIPKEKKVANEKRFLESIDALFTTNLIKEEIKQNNHQVNTPVISIEFPEIDETEKTEKNHLLPILAKDEESIIIAYAGSLYKDLRNPGYLVRLMQELPQNYKLAIAGINTSMMRDYDESIRDRIIDLGYINQSDVKRLFDDADLLICFNNAVANQVPSKLFEYIETGKPFINFCQLKNCPTLPYVKDYENALTVFVDDIRKDEIVSFVNSHIGKVVSRDRILEKYYRNTIGYVENQIEEEL